MIVVKCYDIESHVVRCSDGIYDKEWVGNERVVCRFNDFDTYMLPNKIRDSINEKEGISAALSFSYKLMYEKDIIVGNKRFTIEEVEEKSAEDEINERALKINFNQSVEWIKELALKVHKLENK